MRRYFVIFGFLLALVYAAPAAAGDVTIGGACLVSNRGQGPQGDGNNAVCISNIWQYPAYQFGSTAASCNGTNAGMVQYTGGVFQGCNGSNWSTFGASSAALSSLLAATTTN